MRKKKIIKEFYAGENILSLTKKGVIIRDLEAGGKMPTTFNGYQVLYPDNLLMCLFDIDVTPRCVGIIKDEGLSSPAYSQFILNELGYTPFFDYLLRYMDDEKCLLHLSKNLRNSLTEDDFGQIETIVPSFPEQQAIADYLDWKCGEIDELITLQEEMITKLQSYKQSVIIEAVTKGLNKNVPLKDSGVEWIGEIPEPWRIICLKRLCRISTGNQDTQDSIPDGKYPFFVRSPKVERSNNYTFEGPSILMAGDGVGAGKVFHLADNKFACHQRVYCINQFSVIVNRIYLFYYMSSLFYNIIDSANSKSTVDSVRLPMLAEFPVCIPLKYEQQAIADYLDQKCSEIDELISIKQQKIEKLKEYKKSLIFECVTGKRKVS